MDFSQGNIFLQLNSSKAFSDLVDDWASFKESEGQNRGGNACWSSVPFSYSLEECLFPSASFTLSFSLSLSLSQGFLNVCLLACLGLFFPPCTPFLPSLLFRSLSYTLIVSLPHWLSWSVSLSVSLLPSVFLPVSLSLLSFCPSLPSSLAVSPCPCLYLSASPSPPSLSHTHCALSQAWARVLLMPTWRWYVHECDLILLWLIFSQCKQSLLSLVICPFTNKKTVSLV